MNTFRKSGSQVFRNALRACKTFPAANLAALGFAVVTMIRIQLDWPAQEAYNLLFNCLHWAFACGAVFSLAAITAAQNRFNTGKAFLSANLAGAAVTLFCFLMLYFFGAQVAGTRYATITSLAAARVSAGILLSLVGFIITAGLPPEKSGFDRALFMTEKAFFIALLYGLVILAGAFGVVRAFQALLYQGMSGKVYQYILTLAGFLTFSIFTGYFPDFRKDRQDEQRTIAEKQPRFIELLFGGIMIPIVMALTVVLFAWIGRIIFTRAWPSFSMLAGIATGYAVFGIWLHLMVTRQQSAIAKFYRKFYPLAALLILIFELWALLLRLNESGLKVEEYAFAVTWIFSAIAAILLFWKKENSHNFIAVLLCALAVFSVLPKVGYLDLPVSAQVNRLEKLLLQEDLLQNGELVAAVSLPEMKVRQAITDAVNFLAYTNSDQLPAWFARDLGDSAVFKQKLGFEPAFVSEGPVFPPVTYLSTSLIMPNEALDVSAYRWAILMQSEGKDNMTAAVSGDRGNYFIQWSPEPKTGMPVFRIKLNDNLILEDKLNTYLARLLAAYPPGQTDPVFPPIADMCLVLETPEVNILLVFRFININLDLSTDTMTYRLEINTIYLAEKA
ncbi:MAG: DUF4153 domain-containing protein [Negativicutes bacterium]|nr:DUF4153 domain-containing protein [Negativicutes bacterium]